MSIISWNDVLSRKNLIGGSIESQTGIGMVRGPIAQMVDAGKTIEFLLPWSAFGSLCAVGSFCETTWKKVNDQTTWGVAKEFSSVYEKEDGRICFSQQCISFTIYPKGHECNLDPKIVENFTPVKPQEKWYVTYNWTDTFGTGCIKTERVTLAASTKDDAIAEAYAKWLSRERFPCSDNPEFNRSLPDEYAVIYEMQISHDASTRRKCKVSDG